MVARVVRLIEGATTNLGIIRSDSASKLVYKQHSIYHGRINGSPRICTGERLILTRCNNSMLIATMRTMQSHITHLPEPLFKGHLPEPIAMCSTSPSIHHLSTSSRRLLIHDGQAGFPTSFLS